MESVFIAVIGVMGIQTAMMGAMSTFVVCFVMQLPGFLCLPLKFYIPFVYGMSSSMFCETMHVVYSLREWVCTLLMSCPHG